MRPTGGPVTCHLEDTDSRPYGGRGGGHLTLGQSTVEIFQPRELLHDVFPS